MAVIYKITEINKRDLWNNNDSARWALFAIFIAIILIIVVGTLRVNKKRSNNGLQPMYGTRWMTPPTYHQSQTSYDQNVPGGDIPTNYVPTYTATANDQDMGYYDRNGIFHANPNAKSGSISGGGNFQFSNDNDIVQHPDSSHARNFTPSDPVVLHNMDDLDMDLTRPNRSNVVRSDEGLHSPVQEHYEPPSGPPPASTTPASAPAASTTTSALPPTNSRD